MRVDWFLQKTCGRCSSPLPDGYPLTRCEYCREEDRKTRKRSWEKYKRVKEHDIINIVPSSEAEPKGSEDNPRAGQS